MSEWTDAELLAALRHVFAQLDPPPEHVGTGAREAFLWHAIDAELADLVYDSHDQPLERALVRGADTAREVTFRAPGIEVEVMVTSDRQRTLVGQLVPAQEAGVELLHGGGSASVRTDALGRFAFDGIAAGAIKLVVTAAGTRIQTAGLVI